MDIKNKTKRPLRVPLPGGKKLHLIPGGTGQIAPEAAEHPPLKKLIDEGEIEIVGFGRSQGSGASPSAKPKGSTKGDASAGGGMRHVGDR